MTFEQAVAEYAASVRRRPSHYKARVAADPEAAARAVLDGLSESELSQFMSSLRREECAVAKAEGN